MVITRIFLCITEIVANRGFTFELKIIVNQEQLNFVIINNNLYLDTKSGIWLF